MKVPVTKENVFDRDPYKSILFLLFKFQDNGGLRQRHFRYALTKDNNKYNLDKLTFKEVESFFGDKLKSLYDKELISHECIKSKNSLNNFLRTLVDLNIIVKYDRKNETKWRTTTQGFYKLSDDFIIIAERLYNKHIIDWYNTVIIHNTKFGKHLLYGFNSNMLKTLDKDKRNTIYNCLSKIENELIEINLIQSSKVNSVIRKHLKENSNLYNFKKQHLDNEGLILLIDNIIRGFPILVYYESFEIAPKTTDKKPSGYPFDKEYDVFDLSDNIINHRYEIFNLVGLEPEIGDSLFELFKSASKHLRNTYDLNVISYSYITGGVETNIDNFVE